MDETKIVEDIATKMSKVMPLENINRILNANNFDTKEKILFVQPYFQTWFKENFSDMKNKKVMSKYIKYRA